MRTASLASLSKILLLCGFDRVEALGRCGLVCVARYGIMGMTGLLTVGSHHGPECLSCEVVPTIAKHQ